MASPPLSGGGDESTLYWLDDIAELLPYAKTISTVTIQAGTAKFVLAILKVGFVFVYHFYHLKSKYLLITF